MGYLYAPMSSSSADAWVAVYLVLHPVCKITDARTGILLDIFDLLLRSVPLIGGGLTARAGPWLAALLRFLMLLAMPSSGCRLQRGELRMQDTHRCCFRQPVWQLKATNHTASPCQAFGCINQKLSKLQYINVLQLILPVSALIRAQQTQSRCKLTADYQMSADPQLAHKCVCDIACKLLSVEPASLNR